MSEASLVERLEWRAGHAAQHGPAYMAQDWSDLVGELREAAAALREAGYEGSKRKWQARTEAHDLWRRGLTRETRKGWGPLSRVPPGALTPGNVADFVAAALSDASRAHVSGGGDLEPGKPTDAA